MIPKRAPANIANRMTRTQSQAAKAAQATNGEKNSSQWKCLMLFLLFHHRWEESREGSLREKFRIEERMKIFWDVRAKKTWKGSKTFLELLNPLFQEKENLIMIHKKLSLWRATPTHWLPEIIVKQWNAYFCSTPSHYHEACDDILCYYERSLMSKSRRRRMEIDRRIKINRTRRLIAILGCVGEQVVFRWINLGDTNISGEDDNQINSEDA